jgi:flagellar biosynthesis protein FlhG
MVEHRSKVPKRARKLGRGLSEVSSVFLSGAEGADAGAADAADIRLWMPDAHIISITSGVGVCGKTLLAANLGFGLHDKGRKVAYVDADQDRPGIIELTGSAPAGGDQPFMRTNEAFGGVVAIDVESGTHAGDKGGAGPGLSIGHIDAAARLAQTVLIDTSPKMESSRAVWQLARLVLVLTEPATDKMRASYATIKQVCGVLKGGRIGLIVNMAKDYYEAEQCFRKISNVCRRFLKMNPRNYGFIVHSDAVREACGRAVPLVRAFPGSKAAACIESILGLIVMDESAIARRRREVTVEECALKGGA